jgi:hypothetical protein
MAAYAYKTYIGNDYCICFADAHENKAVQQVNIVYPFGLWTNDATMRRFAAYLGREKGILTNPAALYDKSGNFPTLGRELFFLRHINVFMSEQPKEPLLKDVWLPDLQVMAARRGDLYVAMKGGTNGESHNHNDVGSFIVYASTSDKKSSSVSSGEVTPLLIDPAVGEYTAKTFSNDRYSIWTMQSQYHNLPQINGIDQKDGKEYAARIVSHKDGQLTLDIAGAYPAEAAVKTWDRTVLTMKSGIYVTEEYELRDFIAPTRLLFITTVKPEISQNARPFVRLGSHRIDYNSSQLSATIEDVSDHRDPVLQQMWGQQMYRIILTVKSTKTKNKIKYTIR